MRDDCKSGIFRILYLMFQYFKLKFSIYFLIFTLFGAAEVYSKNDFPVVTVAAKGGFFGTGFFVSPELIVTSFDNLLEFEGSVQDYLFIIHPETGKEVPINFIQGLDFKNDLALLQVHSAYRSPVYYMPEIFTEAYPIASRRAYVLSVRGGENSRDVYRLEGLTTSRYDQEDSFMKTMRSITHAPVVGLNGAPVLLEDNKLIGVVNYTNAGANFFFSEMTPLNRLLSQPFLQCSSHQCIEEAVSVQSSDKEIQYRQGMHRMRKSLLYSKKKHLKARYDNIISTAEQWLRMSALQDYAPASYVLSRIHFRGLGVFSVNLTQYEYFLTQSAQNGFERAKFELGRFLKEKGLTEQGLSWLDQSAEGGDFPSLYELSMHHFNEGKMDQSLQYLERLAVSGSLKAKYELSYYLFEGQYIEKDIPRAQELLQESAQGRYPPAVFEMYLAYEEGHYGFQKDTALSEEFLNRAVKLGEPRALEMQKALRERGTVCSASIHQLNTH